MGSEEFLDLDTPKKRQLKYLEVNSLGGLKGRTELKQRMCEWIEYRFWVNGMPTKATTFQRHFSMVISRNGMQISELIRELINEDRIFLIDYVPIDADLAPLYPNYPRGNVFVPNEFMISFEKAHHGDPNGRREALAEILSRAD